MPSFLTNLIPGGWVLYLVIALAVFTAGSFAGSKFRSSQDAPIIAHAQVAQAQAEADTQRVRTALSDQQKTIALDAQAASEKALATQTALQGQVAALTAKLNQTEKARQAASTKLLDTLKAIPNEQRAALSPSVRAYLDSVRSQQTGGANPAPAANRNPDPPGVPARTAGVP